MKDKIVFDLPLRPYSRNTDIHFAIQNKQEQKLNELLHYGANPDQRDGDVEGWTPLIWAIYERNVKMIEILLKYGADPNLPTFNGTTPLMKTIQGAPMRLLQWSSRQTILVEHQLTKEILLLLLKYKADIYKKNNNGENVFDICYDDANRKLLKEALDECACQKYREPPKLEIPAEEKYSRVISFNFGMTSDAIININSLQRNTDAYFENKQPMFSIKIIEELRNHISLRITTDNKLIKKSIEEYNLPRLYTVDHNGKIKFVYQNDADDEKAIRLFYDLCKHAEAAKDQNCIKQLNEIFTQIKTLKINPPNCNDLGYSTLVIPDPNTSRPLDPGPLDPTPLQSSLKQGYVR